MTLLETLIALCIFSLVVVAIMQLFPVNLAAAKNSRNKTIASYLAQAQMEELLSNNYTSIPTGTTTLATLSNYHPDFSDFSSITNVTLVNGDLNLSATDVGLKKISIIIQWKDFGITKSYAIGTLLSKL